MVKKITISVPDDLHEKMMQNRNRFNFSQVFQEAISKKITSIEQFLKTRTEGINMGAIIERLKSEKNESGDNWFEEGKKDGFDWGTEAHYEEITNVLDIEYDQNNWPINESIKEHLDHLKHDTDGEYEVLFDDYSLSLLGYKYLDGFEEGIKEFWDQIKDKI
jgi:flagellar biosynthesis/type III secretory pathway protein FliH